MTRRLDGYRSSAAGVLLYLVAFAAVSPLLFGAAPAQASFREVTIADDDFEPPEIIIQRGDTVVWVHRGARPHGVRATDGSFDSNPGCSFQNGGACMRSGDRYSRTFDQAGTFAYFCPVHGSSNGVGMAGQVTVASDGGGGGTTTAPPPTTTTRPKGTTTMAPPTSGASTTRGPGAAPTTTPTTLAGSPPAPTAAPAVGQTTVVPVPSQDPGATTTSLVAGVPIGGDTGGDDDGGSNLLIGLAVAVVLAAAVSAAAWQYRPGARPPGPPPPVTPA